MKYKEDRVKDTILRKILGRVDNSVIIVSRVMNLVAQDMSYHEEHMFEVLS